MSTRETLIFDDESMFDKYEPCIGDYISESLVAKFFRRFLDEDSLTTADYVSTRIRCVVRKVEDTNFYKVLRVKVG